MKVCVPVKICRRHGLQDPFATKKGYIRGQEDRGGRKGRQKEESMAKKSGGLEPLTLTKCKERPLPFLSETH